MPTFDNDSWVVLFSASQRTFHIETVEEMLTSNLRTALDRTLTDWMVLSIAATHVQASRDCDLLERKFQEQGLSVPII